MQIIIQLFLLVLGFLLLIKGADKFVEGSSKIADKFHIPQLVIGLTIVAFGTSAPEAAVSITAALNKNADIAISNVLGSNIFNILVIIGITSIILPLTIQKSTLKFELPYVILTTLVLLLLGLDGTLGIVDGIILWVMFIIFFIYLIRLSKSGSAQMDDVPEASANDKIPILLLITVLGMAAIIIGSDITVDSATKIAEILGMSPRFIGLTIVAFGTSLPELITSITAAKKGKDDIAVGNIVGSNLFNILFVLSTTALITPVPFAKSFIIDAIVAIFAAVLLLLCVIRDRKVGKNGGIIMIISYVAYFAYLVFLK
ncbi:calcium/sodium antiporter [Anaerosporobacter faecicola]|uniref:calcium/sodium antiporter n=1 Tax=Anaerosporobacter faecicola TaxID=2718714 RepID=UPI001A9AABD8|nr:calcium/sodium antiporter [Anaerosporobacter faecicola]